MKPIDVCKVTVSMPLSAFGVRGIVQALAFSVGACVSLGITASLSRCPAPVVWAPRPKVQGHSL